jgi:hypothetical protein
MPQARLVTSPSLPMPQRGRLIFRLDIDGDALRFADLFDFFRKEMRLLACGLAFALPVSLIL